MANRESTLRGQLSPLLTKFAVGYSTPANLIAKKVAPVISSLTNSGTLFSFGKEGFMLYDTERTLRANANRVEFAVGSDTYLTAEHAIETALDYDEIKQAEKFGQARILQLERRAVGFTQQILETELEKAVADIVFSATYYASGNKETLSGTDQWSHASSNPITKIKEAKKAARADMGVEPNTLILGYDTYYALASNPTIKAMVSGNKDKELVLGDADLARLLKFKSVIVGEKTYSTDAGVFTDIWTDNAAMIYLPAPGELAEGTTPHTVIIEEAGYPAVKVYDEKKVRSYETTRKYVVKNINTSFGYLFSDCVLDS